MGILGSFYPWVSDGCVGDGDSEGATTQSRKGEWAIRVSMREQGGSIASYPVFTGRGKNAWFQPFVHA